MRLDAFERLVSYAAVFFLVVPPIVVPIKLLFSEDRAFVVVLGIVYFGVGVALKIASRRFKTDLRAGLQLVNYCFYLFSAGALAGFVHQFLADPVFLAPGVLLDLVNFVGTLVLLLVIKKTIDGIKTRNVGSQPEKGHP